MFHKSTFLILIISLMGFKLSAQRDTMSKINFSVYGDVYYSYDFSEPYGNEKPAFIYNHKRHNEVNANLLILKAAYKDTITRGNLALMAGNYPQYNLSHEPLWASFIYEANVGVKLNKRRQLWLDAGIFPSHIGFESAISADCWTLTRSILAENSPYYEAGIRLSNTNKNENFYWALMALNGWQTIQRPPGINTPSFGLQLNYKIKEKLTLNYSNFVGSTQPDSNKAIRTFHNLYLQYESGNKWGAIAGFDIGSDKIANGTYSTWYSPVVIVRYAVNKKIKAAIRGEYYYDKNQIIITTQTANGFQVMGYSANLDFNITEGVLFRIEGKLYHSKDPIFKNNTSNNFALTSSLTYKID
ncbi:MAG: porin [Bacteroidota bacterium]